VSRSIEEDILRQLKALPDDQQQRVLDFANALATTTPRQVLGPGGVPGHTLLRFAGTIAPEDLRQMTQVVEEDCERVDPGEWQLSA
jgi:hypothetical protein